MAGQRTSGGEDPAAEPLDQIRGIDALVKRGDLIDDSSRIELNQHRLGESVPISVDDDCCNGS